MKKRTIKNVKLVSAGRKLSWIVHTPNLLREVLANPQAQPLTRPIQLLGLILGQVADRAAQLNDDKLNALMLQLTLYSCADPESPDYDPELLEKYRKIREA